MSKSFSESVELITYFYLFSSNALFSYSGGFSGSCQDCVLDSDTILSCRCEVDGKLSSNFNQIDLSKVFLFLSLFTTFYSELVKTRTLRLQKLQY